MNSSPPVVLVSAGLLSKWGFNDGTLPDEALDWIEEHAPDIDYMSLPDRAVITRLVREFLVPILDQDVEVEEIDTCHNPIRAKRVNGVDVEGCWSGGLPNVELTPERVVVPMEDVVRICREEWRP